jgi:hypothetical protein
LELQSSLPSFARADQAKKSTAKNGYIRSQLTIFLPQIFLPYFSFLNGQKRSTEDETTNKSNDSNNEGKKGQKYKWTEK